MPNTDTKRHSVKKDRWQIGFQVPKTDTKRHSVKEDRRQIGFQVPNTDTKRHSVKEDRRQIGFQVPNTDTKRHSVKKDRRQIGFQVPKTDTKRDSVKEETRQLHTGGTAVRWGSNIMYDDQTARLPSVLPQLRSEANRRRTSQYVQDVSQISEPIIIRQTEPVTYAVRGKQHHKDKQSKKETEKHARFDQLDTSNLVPRTDTDVPSMNLQNRSTQQRSNNNVGNSYPSFTVPDDTLVTSHDEQSRHLWSDQDEATTDDVRTMGQERFRMIRDAFETGYFVSVICDYVSSSNMMARIM